MVDDRTRVTDLIFYSLENFNPLINLRLSRRDWIQQIFGVSSLTHMEIISDRDKNFQKHL